MEVTSPDASTVACRPLLAWMLPGAVSLDCDLAVCVLAAPGAVSLYSYLTFVTLNGPAAVLGNNNVALNGGGGVTLGVLGLSLGALFRRTLPWRSCPRIP